MPYYILSKYIANMIIINSRFEIGNAGAFSQDGTFAPPL